MTIAQLPAVPEIDPEVVRKGVQALLARSELSGQEVEGFIEDLVGDVISVLWAIDYPHQMRKFALSQRVADEALSKRVAAEKELQELRSGMCPNPENWPVHSPGSSPRDCTECHRAVTGV